MNVLVTGHTGFVGRNLMEYLTQPTDKSYHLCQPSRHNLLDPIDTHRMFAEHLPDVVVHLAARVGGIKDNMENPVDFFLDNIQMGMNVFSACHKHKAYCILVGTVCSYPRDCPIPFTEIDLWNGDPEPTNGAYAAAKRGLYKLLGAYNQQHGLRGTILLPTNMYGKYNNFDPDTSHVIPAMIRKFNAGTDEVVLWGTGQATREFLHVTDFCRAVLHTIHTCPDYPLPMNITGGSEVSMMELAYMIADITGFIGKIKFDPSKPDGQPRRKSNGRLARDMIQYQPTHNLYDGITELNKWYKSEVSA